MYDINFIQFSSFIYNTYHLKIHNIQESFQYQAQYLTFKLSKSNTYTCSNNIKSNNFIK